MRPPAGPVTGRFEKMSTEHHAQTSAQQIAPLAPLRKTRPNGVPYTRVPEVEAKICELLLLSREDLLSQIQITSRDDARFIPGEGLLYLLRASRAESGSPYYKQLYHALAARILRGLPQSETSDGKSLALNAGRVREETLDRFCDLLIEDCAGYCEKLDFYEVRFDRAVKKLRVNAQRKILPDANQYVRLQFDDSGEVSTEAERAASDYDPFHADGFSDADYRLRLGTAIDSLTPEHRTIVQMISLGFPIDSQDPDAVTIAKTLGKSEKTIRTHRDFAFDAIRKAMNEGGL